MRISTRTIYDSATNQMNSLQTALNKTQLQLSSGDKMLNASDDPIAAARALQVTQSQSINTQLSTNRSNATSTLSVEETGLSSAITIISGIQTSVVQAGNGSLTDSDRADLATQIEGAMNDLLGVANQQDGSGNYLFSGYKTATVPFVLTATGATYQGDQGQPTLQVGATRSIPTSDSGSSVFANGMTGNGTFATTAGAANYTNGGSGIISPGTVSDQSKLTGDNYTISFAVTAADATTNTAASTTYTVLDNTTGLPVPDATPIPYTSGSTIEFDGQQMAITGVPANGDTFSVAPSTKTSLFTTLQTLLTTLRSPSTGVAGNAALSNGLNAASSELSSAYDNVISVRSAVGSRLKEVDSLNSSGDDLTVNYATTLSGLQDLDQVAAISLFTQQQTTLTAAQKSFTAISGLSLFNYISG